LSRIRERNGSKTGVLAKRLVMKNVNTKASTPDVTWCTGLVENISSRPMIVGIGVIEVGQVDPCGKKVVDHVIV